jgi:hypothetical protein
MAFTDLLKRKSARSPDTSPHVDTTQDTTRVTSVATTPSSEESMHTAPDPVPLVRECCSDHEDHTNTPDQEHHEGYYGIEDSAAQIDESRTNSVREMYTLCGYEWSNDALQEESQHSCMRPLWAKSHGRSWCCRRPTKWQCTLWKAHIQS